ncbi:MAG: nucleotidyltransferase family protein [Acidobacteria bacterium]|nr:nucleotidyltransferase family protein [Acidobacteriota bacterium]
MKAYLLAAGPGTRLRPLTDRVPKCLVPVGGEPVLGRWLRACRLAGVDEVLVNTHHLPDSVRAFAEGPGRAHGVRVRLHHEERLLGSAGTVRATRDFVRGEESFFIIYADNVSDVDLASLRDWHARHDDPLTVGLFRAPHPENCGVAVLDGQGRIVEFEEKPPRPASPWASAGIFVARLSLLGRLDEIAAERGGEAGALDFGYHVLPRLVVRGEARGYRIEEFLLDVGTPEGYAEACRRVSQGRA